MTLNVEGFKNFLRDACDYKENPYADLDLRLEGMSEENKKACREEYFTDLRIMKAQSYAELSDLTIEDILNCFQSSNLFVELFEQMKAKSYFDRLDKLRVVKTVRKRRIL